MTADLVTATTRSPDDRGRATGPWFFLRWLIPGFALAALADGHGPSSWIAQSLCGLVGAYMLLRMLVAAVTRMRNRATWIYLGLSLAVCAGDVLRVQLSLRSARAQAAAIADALATRCRREGACPALPEGWERRTDRYTAVSWTHTWPRWPLLYRPDGTAFELRLYVMLDVGEAFGRTTEP